MDKTKRISDQILILQSVAIVREELASADASGDPEWKADAYDRLLSLYACISTEKIVEILKQADERSKHGRG